MKVVLQKGGERQFEWGNVCEGMRKFLFMKNTLSETPTVLSFFYKKGGNIIKRQKNNNNVFKVFRADHNCTKIKAIAPSLELLSHQPKAVVG